MIFALVKNRLYPFILLVILLSILIIFNAFSHIQNTITDGLYKRDGAVLNNIIIIAIDDESIRSIGRWPWNRELYIPVLYKLQYAKAVGLDLSFFESTKNDENIFKIFEKSDSIVLAAEINNNKVYKPIFNTKYGYVNLPSDSD